MLSALLSNTFSSQEPILMIEFHIIQYLKNHGLPDLISFNPNLMIDNKTYKKQDSLKV